MIRHLPNLLSLSRLLAVPFLLILAWQGRDDAFLVLLIVALSTDALDGFIARRFHCESPLGARLDSWGDFAIYSTVPLAAWWLWPDLLRQEAVAVITIMISFLLPVTLGFIKFHGITSYHTWSVKVAAVWMAAALLALFVLEIAWPIRVAAVLCAWSGLEEIAITLLLGERRTNVRSLWHVWRTLR